MRSLWLVHSVAARGGPPAAPSPREYSPPPGPIERVDDPVGDKDGWVRMGDRAFRVTRSSDGALDHLDVPGDARIRPVADGWEVDIPASGERDKYDERRMMRRAPKRLTRSHFSPEQWAAVKLGRKFYQSEVSEGSRRNGAWEGAHGERGVGRWEGHLADGLAADRKSVV